MPAKSDTAAIEKAKKKLGKLIFKCREGNLSQRQLAQAVGLHPSNMKYIEDGVNSPTAEVYTKLIRILSPPPKRRAELDQAYMIIRNTPPPDVCDRVKNDTQLISVIRAMGDTPLTEAQAQQMKALLASFIPPETKGEQDNG